MNKNHIAISNDILIILDSNNNKVLRIFDIKDGTSNKTITHSMEIIKFELNQVTTSLERKVTIIDSNKDCWMNLLNKDEWFKVNTMVDSMKWNNKYDVLCLISDNSIIT